MVEKIIVEKKNFTYRWVRHIKLQLAIIKKKCADSHLGTHSEAHRDWEAVPCSDHTQKPKVRHMGTGKLHQVTHPHRGTLGEASGNWKSALSDPPTPGKPSLRTLGTRSRCHIIQEPLVKLVRITSLCPVTHSYLETISEAYRDHKYIPSEPLSCRNPQ